MLDKRNPLVSVVIPVYNRKDLIVETLDSIVAQTYDNWECILIDDGSIDGSKDVIKKYSMQDSRFKLFERDVLPKGASACRNIGINNSQGEYILFLDSDDLLGTNCLSYRVKKINEWPDLDAIIFQTKLFKQKMGDRSEFWNKLIVDGGDLERFIDFDTPWSIMGPIWRKSKVIKFDETAHSMQDWELHIRQLLNSISYKTVDDESPENLCYCRRDDASNSMGLDFYSKKKMILRNPTFLKIFDRVSENSNPSLSLPLNRFLLRTAVKYRQTGLLKEATSLIEKFDYFPRKFNNRIIRFYIKKFDNTFYRKMIEIYLYKILKKGVLFDPPMSYFSSHA